jgi:hypothetical protein
MGPVTRMSPCRTTANWNEGANDIGVHRMEETVAYVARVLCKVWIEFVDR